METIDLNFVNNKNPEEVFEITDGLIEVFRDDWHRAFEQVKIKIKKETKSNIVYKEIEKINRGVK